MKEIGKGGEKEKGKRTKRKGVTVEMKIEMKVKMKSEAYQV